MSRQLDAEIRAREEAERKLQEQAEKAARDEAERIRREEERARLGEEEERQKIEERKLREVEEEARRVEDEEKAEAEARSRARGEAEAAARGRKEARDREKAEARKREETQTGERESKDAAISARDRMPREPRNWGRTIALGLLVILVVALGVIHVVPLDPAPYEKAASQRFGEPVRIGTVNIALLPLPQLKFDRVTIGQTGTDAEVRIARIKASTEFGSMFAERKIFKSLELEGLVFQPAQLAAAIWGRSDSGSLRIDRVIARAVKVDLGGLTLPALDMEAVLGAEGALQSLTLTNAERKLTARLEPDGARMKIQLEAQKLPLPFGTEFALDELTGKGMISASELTFSEFEARAYDGTLSGNARLRWGATWSLDGEINARQVDATKIASPLMSGGRVEGRLVYSMRSPAPDKLFAAGRAEGSFTVKKGSIANLDMTRVLQGSATTGGSTLFSEMTGNVLADANRTQLRNLRMSAGLLTAGGNVDVEAQGGLAGRIQVELRNQARATLAVSGTLKEPQFRRSN